jgi:hypothetical protein
MSTFSEKFVDFEIAVENESKAQLPSKQGSSPEQTSVLEESVFKISSQLSTISRNQKYFRTRENRNFSTVHSTEKRIINFSMIQIGMVVAMAALQVIVVRFFFQVCLDCNSVRYSHADVVLRAHARATSKGVKATRRTGYGRAYDDKIGARIAATGHKICMEPWIRQQEGCQRRLYVCCWSHHCT